MSKRNVKMSDELRRKLAHRYILFRMIEEGDEIPASLDGDYALIEDLLQEHYDEFWTIKEGEAHYSPTRKGELIYHNFIARWWDFLLTYDIFAGVDLQEGVFADDDADWDAVDEEGRPIWEDLRVAVCIYKQRLAEAEGRQTDLNPFTIAFMCLLSEGRIGREDTWQYDLASDEFWADVEEIVNTNLWPEDLGYVDDETGEEIPGDEVMLDIIEQGIEETKKRWQDDDDDSEDNGDYLSPPEPMRTKEEVIETYEDDIDYYGWGYDPFYYSPYGVIADGLLTAAFIGAVWAVF